MTEKILICEDEQSIRKLIKYNLEKEGYSVVAVGSGEEVIELVNISEFDLLVQDIMLPGIDGFAVCRMLLQQKKLIPVIFLTAKDSEIDTIVGLELGADDYVTKPFSVRELVARVKAVLRRTVNNRTRYHKDEDNSYRKLGHLIIDLSARKVWSHNNLVSLTPIEYELLAFFIDKKGVALHRHEIMDEVWGTDFVGDTRLIDVHVSHLRDKLGLTPDEIGFIETVRGIGYRLNE